jgi:hypothetical protein
LVTEEELSDRMIRGVVCFGTLLTESIKTLIFVRHLGRDDQSRLVNLKLFGKNWEPELVPEWGYPRLEELKEKSGFGMEICCMGD